jgi:pimeloyl-ACP methyl ester carboxylesterase
MIPGGGCICAFARMPHAKHADVSLYYELHGDPARPALVMIRGLARSARFWLDFTARMARSFRVVVMDNRGVGRSDKPLRLYTTRSMADDVQAVLDHAGIAKAHVFGMSLGGMIAMRFALRHPERVDRLVLGCTTMGGRGAKKIPVSSVAKLLSAGRMSFADALEYTAPIVVSPEFLRERDDIVPAWRAIAVSEPVPLKGSALQLLAAAEHDVHKDVRDIRAKTLVLTGDVDRLIPAENSRRLAKEIPGAELVILPGAGHDFTTEQPEPSARALERFLLAP